MIKIGILSDTHSFIHPKVLRFFEDCDEIWHAGDIGNEEVTQTLAGLKPLVGVYGNIDGGLLRKQFPIEQIFQRENIQVLMTHIGGYPGRYTPAVRKRIEEIRPKLFVCGHSHILKIIYDHKHQLLHINPGAAGKYGFHSLITAVRLTLDGDKMSEVEIIEIQRESTQPVD